MPPFVICDFHHERTITLFKNICSFKRKGMQFHRKLSCRYNRNQHAVRTEYAKNYGKERVIEALKTGLNIFLKQKSNIFSKKVNLTDENWQNFLKYVQDKYPIETIEKYLNKGLISNLVFETKNLKNIDTVKLIDLAQKLKKEGKYE